MLAPGPKPHFLLGNLPEFRRDPLGFWTSCARDYGDVVSYRIGNVNAYLLNHPDHIEYVLVKNYRNFIKGRVIQANRRLLGNGLLSNEGDDWLRQRRLAQPAFHRERISEYSKIMVATAERRLAGWRAGETRDLHREMKRLTLEIVAKTLFGADVGSDAEEVAAAIQVAWEAFTRQLKTGLFIPQAIPTPGNLRFRRAVRRLDEIVYSMIRQRRQSGAQSADLLSMLLASRDADHSQMTDTQLRDEVMTLFVAGHETTALALTWTWFLLAGHPAVERRMLAEIEQVLGGQPPTALDIPNLKYMETVVRESMRLYPPIWALPRIVLQDCEIGGYQVPAGSSLTLSQWVMHRDPRYFADPERFSPERWTDDFVRDLPAFAYFPFGAGPRHCIGHSFAMTEAVLLVATMAQRFHFELVPGHPVEPWPSITLYPRQGVRVVLHERSPGDRLLVRPAARDDVGAFAA